jgi:hypothetical protein
MHEARAQSPLLVEASASGIFHLDCHPPAAGVFDLKDTALRQISATSVLLFDDHA